MAAEPLFDEIKRKSDQTLGGEHSGHNSYQEIYQKPDTKEKYSLEKWALGAEIAVLCFVSASYQETGRKWNPSNSLWMPPQHISTALARCWGELQAAFNPPRRVV